MIVFAAIVPHPPLSVSEIGTDEDRKKLKKTLNSFEQIRKGLEKSQPDTIIVISPHGKMKDFSFLVNSALDLSGDFFQFGFEKNFYYKNDMEIVDKLIFACRSNNIPIDSHEDPIDYGTLIPLYHLTKNIDPKIVHISFSLLGYDRHYFFGELIRRVCEDAKTNKKEIKVEKRVAIIASADLSHRLSKSAPLGYSLSAKFFDQKIIELLSGDSVQRLVGFRDEVIKDAAECGFRSILILLGAINKKNYKFHLLSYESPFGIGHLTARFI